MISGRLLMLIGAALGLLAAERLVNVALLGVVSDSSRSVRLGIAFLCGGLAPVFFAIGCFRAAHRSKGLTLARPSGNPSRKSSGLAARRSPLAAGCAAIAAVLVPAQPALVHRWLDTWTNLGLVVGGVERQGLRFSLSHNSRASLNSKLDQLRSAVKNASN